MGLQRVRVYQVNAELPDRLAKSHYRTRALGKAPGGPRQRLRQTVPALAENAGRPEDREALDIGYLGAIQGQLVGVQGRPLLPLAQVGVPDIEQQLDGQHDVLLSLLQILGGGRPVQDRHSQFTAPGIPFAHRSQTVQSAVDVQRLIALQGLEAGFVGDHRLLGLPIGLQGPSQPVEEHNTEMGPIQAPGQVQGSPVGQDGLPVTAFVLSG